MSNSKAFRFDKYASLKSFFGSCMSMFKWMVLPAALSFLAYKLLTFDQYDELIAQWKLLPLSQFWWLASILVLLPFNWLLETVKWKLLVSKIQVINLTDSFKGVLAGISTGFFTPNRVGELVGRVMYLNAGNRKAGVTLSMVNSLTQNIIMAFCGIPACALFFTVTSGKIEINATLYLIILIVSLLIFGLIYFMLPQLSRRFKQSRYSENIKAFTDCLSYYNKHDLLLIMLISLTRYFVFCVQFFFMLRFLSVELTVWQALIAIPTTYLFVTFTPSLAFSEVAVRSSYAVLVISVFSSQVVSIALAGLCIWLVNFVIPMLAGSVVLVRGKKMIL
jgi:uncharacterized membrane protein YbhN (UPF0104 family)